MGPWASLSAILLQENGAEQNPLKGSVPWENNRRCRLHQTGWTAGDQATFCLSLCAGNQSVDDEEDDRLEVCCEWHNSKCPSARVAVFHGCWHPQREVFAAIFCSGRGSAPVWLRLEVSASFGHPDTAGLLFPLPLGRPAG